MSASKTNRDGTAVDSLPEIEMVHDETENLIGQGLQMDPESHQILPDGEWLTWLKRRTRHNDLFMYFHREHGTFVLAQWLRHPSKGTPICSEIEVLNGHPDSSPEHRPGYGLLLTLVRTTEQRIEQLRRRIRDRAARRRSEAESRREQRIALASRLKHAGATGAAAMVASGRRRMPGKTAMSGEITDRLVTAASGREWSIPGFAPGATNQN